MILIYKQQYLRQDFVYKNVITTFIYIIINLIIRNYFNEI